jgi:putative ABC transport system permease protein
MELTFPESRYSQGQQRANFVEMVSAEMKNVPGVLEAGITTVNPLRGGTWGAVITVEGARVSGSDASLVVNHRYVSPGFFRAMGIPLLKGRLLTEQDRAGGQPVAIIDDRMANRFWPGEDPIGKRVKRGRLESNRPWLTVVGVVGSVKDAGDYQETWYLPYLQEPLGPSAETIHLMARTASDPRNLVRPIQQAVWKADKNLAVYDAMTMNQVYAETLSSNRLGTVIISLFAFVGLLLAALGIYGVISYAAGQRTHEIGIRMALGATTSDVLKLVMKQGVVPTFVGLTIGIAAAFALSRLMSSVLFSVEASDPTTFVGVTVVLMVVALLACYVPARRAAKVDPMVALRHE